MFDDLTGENQIKLVVLERYRLAIEIAHVRVNSALLRQLYLIRIYIDARHFPSATLPLFAPGAIGAPNVQQRSDGYGLHDGNAFLQSAFFPVVTEIMADVILGNSLHIFRSTKCDGFSYFDPRIERYGG